jgi:hypothetical protein
MAKIAFQGVLPVSNDDLLRHVAHSKSLGYPEVVEQEIHGRRLAVIGGGPSIVDHLEEIRGFTDIWAINGACGFLREHGIESTLLSLDPCDFLAPRVAGATKALLASRCHPDVVETLKGADITLFDATTDASNGMWASCASVTVAFQLSMTLGYRQTVFYGCEGSYSEKTHAYMDEAELQDYRFVVECGGKQYLTAPDLYMLTQQMAMFFKLAINGSFTERSGGLLRALIENEEHDIVQVSRALMGALKPRYTLVQGLSQVHVGFKPHDLGVTVHMAGHDYKPEWRLVSDMQSRTDNPGPPEFWCTDGHRIYFDKPADADYSISAEAHA